MIYTLVGLTLWMTATPRTSQHLSSAERSLLVSASDVAGITKDFVPEPGREVFQKQTLLLGSESLLYEYDSSTPNHPRIACLLQRRSGLIEGLSDTAVMELFGDYDWKSDEANQSGMVAMVGGRQLGEESESFFLYENGRAVGNLISVRIGSARLSVLLSGVVLLNEDEVERLLRPALERLAHSRAL